MKTIVFLLIGLFFINSDVVVAQDLSTNTSRRISEGTIYYDIFFTTGNNAAAQVEKNLGGTQTVSLKGYMSRVDIANQQFLQSTIIDAKAGNIKLLKTLGGQQYLIEVNRENWDELNRKYENAKVVFGEEFKNIAGFNCQKALVTFKDGTSSAVFFTRELIAEHRDFEYAFKSIPGLVMENETAVGNNKVTYSVSKISFNIVPTSKFELPKSGYRVMTYEESKQINNRGN